MVLNFLRDNKTVKFIRFQMIKKAYGKLNQQLSINDKDYLEKYYYKRTGKKLDINNPENLNEKLIWMKLFYRNPLMTQCTDKYLVREYVKKCGLEHTLNEIYNVYDDARQVDFNNLPADKVFLKCNHTSGDNRLYDKNKFFDKKDFIRTFNFMLKQNYYVMSREWNYKNIKPKIISEKVFEDSNLVDYRFFCFHGEVKLLMVDIETAAEDGRHAKDAKRNIYDENYNLLNFSIGRQTFDPNYAPKPKNFDLMKEYAEKLSKPFPFVRVDLYNFDGQIYFGEMTFFPGGCTQEISNKEWENEISSWLDLDKIKSHLNLNGGI